MTVGVGLVALAVAAGTATCVLIIQELHLRALDTRVSNAVMGIPYRSAPFQDVTNWYSWLGMRYRRFYAEENLDQLRAILQSSGFNHRRALPTWIGVKAVSMFLCPVMAAGVALLFGKALTDVLVFTLIGVMIGILGPRLILAVMKRRVFAPVPAGTAGIIDLLVGVW